jgi:hypothetical protein
MIIAKLAINNRTRRTKNNFKMGIEKLAISDEAEKE